MGGAAGRRLFVYDLTVMAVNSVGDVCAGTSNAGVFRFSTTDSTWTLAVLDDGQLFAGS